MADDATETYGIVVKVEDQSAEAGRTFTRTADDIAESAKKSEDSASGLTAAIKELGAQFQAAAEHMGGSSKQAKKEVSELQKTLAELKESSVGVRESLERIDHGFETLNTGLRALGVGAVIVEFRELFEVGKELEEGLVHLQIASGATKDDMEELEQSTTNLSNSFGKSQIKVVAAQLEAARAGFTGVTENAQVTTAALELSKIGFVDTGVAVDTLTRVMQAFDAPASDAKGIMESMFVVAKEGKFNVEDLNQVFGRLSPILGEAGVSINEILGSLGALGQTGTRTYVAMSGMQQILRQVAEPIPGGGPEKAFDRIRDSLHAAGVEAVSLQDLVKQKGLQGATQLISSTVGGDKRTLADIFGGQQGGQAAFALANTAAEKYGQTMLELADKERIAAAADKLVTDGAAYQAETFRSRIQNSLIGLAGGALKALTPMFEFLNSHFKGLELIAGVLIVTLGARLVVSAVVAASALLRVGLAAREAGEAMTLLGKAAFFMGGEWVLVLGVVLSVAAAIYDIVTSSNQASAAMDNLAEVNRKFKEDKEGTASDKGGKHSIVKTGDDALDSGLLALEDRKDKAEKASQKTLSDNSNIVSGGFGFGINQTGVASEDERNAAKSALKAAQDAVAQRKRDINYIDAPDDRVPESITPRLLTGQDTFATTPVLPALKTVETQLPTAPSPLAPTEQPMSFRTGAEESAENARDTAAAKAGELAEAVRPRYQEVMDATNAAKKAQLSLNQSYAEGKVVVGDVTVTAQQWSMVQQKNRAVVIDLAESYTALSRALKTTEVKNDPWAALVNERTVALHALKVEAGKEGQKSDDPEFIKAQEEIKEKSYEAAQALEFKTQAEAAGDSETKNYITTVAAQVARLNDLNRALRDGHLTQRQLTAAQADAGFIIAKAALATELLTTGQMKYNEALLTETNARRRVAASNDPHNAEALNMLAEFAFGSEQAGEATDSLALKVIALAGAYDPIIAIQKKYLDQGRQVEELAKVRPELAPQLQTARILAPLQQQQEQDKSLALPAVDKNSIESLDQYQLSFAKLATEYSQGYLTLNQYNQGVLETDQAYAVANQEFNDYTKAVMDGAKAMDQAMTTMLETIGERGHRLRGVFEGLAKSLQGNASELLTKALESKLFSAMAGSNIDWVKKLGLMAASATGVPIKAKEDSTPVSTTLTDKDNAAISQNLSDNKELQNQLSAMSKGEGGTFSGKDTIAAPINQVVENTGNAASSLEQIVSLLQSAKGAGGAGGGGTGVADQAAAAKTASVTSDPSASSPPHYVESADGKEIRAERMGADAAAFPGVSSSVAAANDSDLNPNQLGASGTAPIALAQGSANPTTGVTAAGAEQGALGAGLSAAANIAGGENTGRALGGAAETEGTQLLAQQGASWGTTALRSLFMSEAGVAGGGNVSAGTSHVVGETGPEVVSFGADAHVDTAAQVASAVGAASASKSPTVVSSPTVNVPVQVVNVSDPSEIPTTMQGSQGTKAILNVMARNRTAVNSVLGNN